MDAVVDGARRHRTADLRVVIAVRERDLRPVVMDGASGGQPYVGYIQVVVVVKDPARDRPVGSVREHNGSNE